MASATRTSISVKPPLAPAVDQAQVAERIEREDGGRARARGDLDQRGLAHRLA